MARSEAIRPQLDPDSGEAQVPASALQEFYLVAIPRAAWKALSDQAAAQGLTFSQLLSRAIDRELSSPSR